MLQTKNYNVSMEKLHDTGVVHVGLHASTKSLEYGIIVHHIKLSNLLISPGMEDFLFFNSIGWRIIKNQSNLKSPMRDLKKKEKRMFHSPNCYRLDG